jgi:uncharacterized protein (TIRG00374 family)
MDHGGHPQHPRIRLQANEAVNTTPAASIRPDDEDLVFSGWRWRAAVWSVLLAAMGYLGFSLWGGWHDVANAVARVGVLGVLISLALSMANYGLRFVRWQAYLRAMEHPMPWWPSLRIYVAGFALTTTPGKAGEALRGVLLKRWGVPYATSLAAFLSERLSDLLAVVLLTLLGLTAYPAAQPLIAVAAGGVLIAFTVLSNQRLLGRLHGAVKGSSYIGRLLGHLFEILLQARRCHAPMLLVGATGLSLVAWAAEAWAFHLILTWMGLEVPFAFSVFVYAISMLAGALSFMPGGLGGAEGVMVALLIWKGAGSADAIAATVLIRLATLWFAVGLGVITISVGNIGPRANDGQDRT